MLLSINPGENFSIDEASVNGILCFQRISMSGDWKNFPPDKLLARKPFRSCFLPTPQMFVVLGAKENLFQCQYDSWPCGLVGAFLEAILLTVPTTRT